jgi:hypothetical protein
MPDNKTIQIEATVEQIEIISESVEFLSRVLLGQLPVMAEKMAGAPGVPSDYANELKEQLYQIQMKLGLHTAMHSEKSPEKAKVAWDIHQVLRQQLFFAHGRTEPSVVDRDDPFPASKHPLITSKLL